MSNNEDVIASVVENQDGQLNEEVGQDEGINNEESSTQDWEAQAKYHQSEKDKLYAENQNLKQYEKIGRFLESRPDFVQNIMSDVSGQSSSQSELVALKPDEFDPWEAYNDPSSKSYKFRMQEMQGAISGAVDQAVGGLKAKQGRSDLRADLTAKGLNEEQVNSFFEFADKHPSEYGLDNVLKMWQAVTQNPSTAKDNPLDQIRQNQANPQPAGVLQGTQPERTTEADDMWKKIVAAGGRTNVLK